MKRASLMLVGVAALAACSSADRSAQPPAFVRDSADVRLVDNAAPALDEPPFTIAPESSLSLGVLDGDAPFLFDGVSAVNLLPGGDIMVHDYGSAELRRFSSNGEHRWSAGRRGAGPGEFQQPFYLGLDPSGAFLVWDRGVSRLTTFDADGSLDRITTYDSIVGRFPGAYGRFPDGALLATLPTSISPPTAGAQWTDTVAYWRAPVAGSPTVIAKHPGPTRLWTGRDMLLAPFTTNPVRAVRGNNVVSSSGAMPTVHVHRADGRLIARYAIARAAVAVSSGDIDEWVQTDVERDAQRQLLWDRWRTELSIPSHRPAYDHLIVSANGDIWLQHYEPRHDADRARTWDVLSEDGIWLGTINTPVGLRVMAVSATAIAGVARDDLDMELVRVHDLRVRPDR